ncbi:MAG: HlyC/CorC family transporter [Candidatus Hydrogenedentes bacterium]|nr:HlyC/CorC family transporter [Candidatus Hydrogenedentota bacterium]
MIDDGSPRRRVGVAALRQALLVLTPVLATGAVVGAVPSEPVAIQTWMEFLPPGVLAAVAILLGCSAFFSASETAFFSIHKLRLRSMSEEPRFTGRLVARMMAHPGRLLTTILVGNMIVNTLISVLLGTSAEDIFQQILGLPEALAYAGAVVVCTGVLVFCGEITPKVFAVRTSEVFARFAVVPLYAVDYVLAPLRTLLLKLTDFLFVITRFHEVRAAPFITDEELKSVLDDGEAQGVIEEEERQMIEGILEFTDALLREILVPRPDIVALPENATVAEALAQFREHECRRVPVYREDLDHVTGILVIKDLLPSVAKGELERPVRTFARPPYFVPKTMTVQQFLKDAQRHRTHLAVVVDEYGGTAGIVTMNDAISEVVGEIAEEDEPETPSYRRVQEGMYLVEGNLSLEELAELIGVKFEEEGHSTVGGFVMNHLHKVPQTGDQLKVSGVQFTVEECEGMRASKIRVLVAPPMAGRAGGGRAS